MTRRRTERALRIMILSMSSVWMISASACVVAVVDNLPDDCEDVVCGDQAYCSAGACSCAPGYGGDPYTACEPFMEVLLTDACDDGLDVEFRLFSLDTTQTWPTSSTLFTAGLDVDTVYEIRCEEGELVCFGARAGDLVWALVSTVRATVPRPFDLPAAPNRSTRGISPAGDGATLPWPLSRAAPVDALRRWFPGFQSSH